MFASVVNFQISAMLGPQHHLSSPTTLLSLQAIYSQMFTAPTPSPVSLWQVGREGVSLLRT